MLLKKKERKKEKQTSARREHSPHKWLDSRNKKGAGGGQKREKLVGDLHGCLQTRRPTGLLPAPGLPAEVLPLPWQQHPEILLGFVLRLPVGSGPRRGCPACEGTCTWAAWQAAPSTPGTTAASLGTAPSPLLLPRWWGRAISVAEFITSQVLNLLWCSLRSYRVLPLTSAAPRLLQLYGKLRINRAI